MAEVTQEIRIRGYDDMMQANALMMDEVYNDRKLTASERLARFTIGIRNQVMLSRDLAHRRAELFKYGMKSSSEIRSLTFNPLESDETKN